MKKGCMLLRNGVRPFKKEGTSLWEKGACPYEGRFFHNFIFFCNINLLVFVFPSLTFFLFCNFCQRKEIKKNILLDRGWSILIHPSQRKKEMCFSSLSEEYVEYKEEKDRK